MRFAERRYLETFEARQLRDDFLRQVRPTIAELDRLKLILKLRASRYDLESIQLLIMPDEVTDDLLAKLRLLAGPYGKAVMKAMLAREETR